MKTAIYIEEGVMQMSLTPETEWEKSVFEKLGNGNGATVEVHRGTFYHCQGGWDRHGPGNDSLIFRIGVPKPMSHDEIQAMKVRGDMNLCPSNEELEKNRELFESGKHPNVA